MPKANYHIYGSHGNVSIKKEGASRASKTRINSREEAYKITKNFSKNQGGGEIMIHKVHGGIGEKNTIPKGNDPRNIRG